MRGWSNKGWSTPETETAANWIQADGKIYSEWSTRAAEMILQNQGKVGAAQNELTEVLRAEYDPNRADLDGIYKTMLQAAMVKVNWHEIAAGIIEEVRPDTDQG